ncbi:hypothetical protein B5E77_10785 [Lachnoclostridium sp. An131]|nr:hypothetical protein B5E77_10785 [Lachnoclostridium sp. An131]
MVRLEAHIPAFVISGVAADEASGRKGCWPEEKICRKHFRLLRQETINHAVPLCYDSGNQPGHVHMPAGKYRGQMR